MKDIWQIKFEELLLKTKMMRMWMAHQNEDSKGLRKYDPFIKTIGEEIDQIINSLPKDEHEQLN